MEVMVYRFVLDLLLWNNRKKRKQSDLNNFSVIQKDKKIVQLCFSISSQNACSRITKLFLFNLSWGIH